MFHFLYKVMHRQGPLINISCRESLSKIKAYSVDHIGLTVDNLYWYHSSGTILHIIYYLGPACVLYHSYFPLFKEGFLMEIIQVKYHSYHLLGALQPVLLPHCDHRQLRG